MLLGTKRYIWNDKMVSSSVRCNNDKLMQLKTETQNKVTKLKRATDNSIWIAEEVNTSVSIIDRTRQKVIPWGWRKK